MWSLEKWGKGRDTAWIMCYYNIVYLIFRSQIVFYFWQSVLVRSFYIDIVWILTILIGIVKYNIYTYHRKITNIMNNLTLYVKNTLSQNFIDVQLICQKSQECHFQILIFHVFFLLRLSVIHCHVIIISFFLDDLWYKNIRNSDKLLRNAFSLTDIYLHHVTVIISIILRDDKPEWVNNKIHTL